MKTDPRAVALIVGTKIKRRRKSLKMKQRELAEEIQLTRTSIANIETGRQNVGLINLVMIADALHCDLSDLLPKIR